MRRRDFIALVGGAGAALGPFPSLAQQSMPVVGYLGSQSLRLDVARVRAFRQGLAESGYVEGRDVAIEYRWAEGQSHRLPHLADELVRRQVVIIATGGVPAVMAAKSATKTIPILFQVGVDPVKLGLVASLNRPGGNLTGVSNLNIELGPKRLELLHQAVPAVTDFVMMLDPTNPNVEHQARELQAASRTLGLRVEVIYARDEQEFERAIAGIAQRGPAGLVIGNAGLFNSRSERLAELTARRKVPTIFQFREFVAAGGLMSYGASFSEPFRQIGTYAGRILKGETAAELPVHQSTKLELFINLKTAKALGLILPPTLLAIADEVIE